MSAEKGNLSKQENFSRSNELYQDLLPLGHNVTKANGAYVENYGKPDARRVKGERSFIVTHKNIGDDKCELHNNLMTLGKKYDQDSILHKNHNSKIANLYGTNKTGWPGNGKIHPVGTLKMNKAGEFHTRLKDGRVFSFDNESS